MKWLGSLRLAPVVAMGKGEQVVAKLNQFTKGSYRCLILSYETFRGYLSRLEGYCDLLVLDEGHRLKNKKIKTFQSFAQFKCPRKIILTGTPLQNSLEELFSCCDFVNPGKFYSYQTFRKVFATPILEGLRKDARPDQRELAQ